MKTSLEFLVVKELTFETRWVLLSFFSSFSSMSLRKRCSGYLNYVTPGCDLWSTGTRCHYTANCLLVLPHPSSPLNPLPSCSLTALSILAQEKLCWLRSLPEPHSFPIPSLQTQHSQRDLIQKCPPFASLPAQLLYQDDSWWNPSLHVTSYTTPWKIALTPWHLFSTAIMLKAIMLPWKID